MADREKKRGGQKYKKFENLENEKSFLDEFKSIFHNFWRSIVEKIADTSLMPGGKKGNTHLNKHTDTSCI